MFFAKEMNYLATRMCVLSKANALIDLLQDVPLKVLNTIGIGLIPNSATDFDDMGFEWHVPSHEDLLEHCREQMENGNGFYESKITLELSQENPRFEAVEKSLETSVRIIFNLSTIAFDKDEEEIDKDCPYAQSIDLTIIVDKNGAHIDEHLSDVNIDIDKFKDQVNDELPISRSQLEEFFNETLRAIDTVNGTEPSEGYLRKLGDKEFNTYGISFDEDGFHKLEDELKSDYDE